MTTSSITPATVAASVRCTKEEAKHIHHMLTVIFRELEGYEVVTRMPFWFQVRLARWIVRS